jgi:ATP-dependent DNA helicase DinG
MWPGSEEPWALYVSGWYSRDGTAHTTSHAAPSDVSWAIRELQQQYPVAAMTSATVPEHRSLRLTFGMPPQGEPSDDQTRPWLVESRLESPYPLRDMGVTVVPRGPSPKDRSWRAWAANAVVEAVRQSEGRALILASSNAQMRTYGEALREHLSYPVKVQREEGRAALREWFKNTVEGVLVATRSFFQGLDVQGDSLSLVVIDRIPFARPGDPVEDAVQRLLIHRNGGGSGYMLRSVPDAAQVLAQGSGRLIRSLSDRGALVVLDNRITKGSPGWRMLRAALPDFPLSFNLDDVGNVLARRPLVGTPGPPTTRSSSVRF